jgi:hypothetical protein
MHQTPPPVAPRLLAPIGHGSRRQVLIRLGQTLASVAGLAPWISYAQSPEAQLLQARDALLGRSAQQGRLLRGSALDERVQRLAGPILSASRALQPDWVLSRWRIDLVTTERSDGLNILNFGAQDLLIEWPQDPSFDLPDRLLVALLAHGVAHGLRGHAREAVLWPSAGAAGAQAEAIADLGRLSVGPRFEVIAEREADRDTTELLARAGHEPRLAWTLRETLGALRSPSAWRLTHPDPPQAREAIERFAARVAPLVGVGGPRP